METRAEQHPSEQGVLEIKPVEELCPVMLGE